jgi:diadenosine tetraphosphate (Ap4A) HIT family hydrolase
VSGARLYARLKRLVAQLEKDPKTDPATLVAARKALADYEALPKRIKDIV